jgi:hypothetical protein
VVGPGTPRLSGGSCRDTRCGRSGPDRARSTDRLARRSLRTPCVPDRRFWPAGRRHGLLLAWRGPPWSARGQHPGCARRRVPVRRRSGAAVPLVRGDRSRGGLSTDRSQDARGNTHRVGGAASCRRRDCAPPRLRRRLDRGNSHVDRRAGRGVCDGRAAGGDARQLRGGRASAAGRPRLSQAILHVHFRVRRARRAGVMAGRRCRSDRLLRADFSVSACRTDDHPGRHHHAGGSGGRDRGCTTRRWRADSIGPRRCRHHDAACGISSPARFPARGGRPLVCTGYRRTAACDGHPTCDRGSRTRARGVNGQRVRQGDRHGCIAHCGAVPRRR